MLSRRSLITGLGGLFLAGSASYAVGVEPYLHIARYQLSPRGWPSGLGLRIVALADLHICDPFMTVEQVREIVAATNALEPDLVTLLGDFVSVHQFLRTPVPLKLWARELAQINAPFGIHAILGNHDWWDDREVMRRRAGRPRTGLALEDAGIPVYENSARRLRKNGYAFWIGGLGDQWAFPAGRETKARQRFAFQGMHDVPHLLSQLTDDAPLILMAHEPDVFADLSARVTLTLAGHMHGGQIRIFGYSPMLPSRYGDRYRYGHIGDDGRDLIVSGGLGCSLLPVRIGVPPEIVVVDLGNARSRNIASEAGASARP
jgi:uncharacterized protein